VPTIVADDQLAPVADDHILASLIPRARLVLSPDAGHGFLFQGRAWVPIPGRSGLRFPHRSFLPRPPCSQQ
jgi:hypothetical protein